jgi:homospermidine synthase/S-adenosylmethionine/arginine decarboxylase-like enzyme
VEVNYFNKYILIKFYNCDKYILNDYGVVKKVTKEVSDKIDNKTEKKIFPMVNPYGLSVLIATKDTRLIFNTLISNGYAEIGLFTSLNMFSLEDISRYVSKEIKANRYEILDDIPMIPTKEEKDLNYLNKYRFEEKIQTCQGTPTISILGSSGGVAKSVLAILNKVMEDKNDPIYNFVCNCQFHLVDVKQKNIEYFNKWFPNLKDKICLYEFDLKDTDKFKTFLKNTNSTHVIDISYADTLEMLRCCNELKVVYINTAFENTSVDENVYLEGFTLQERYAIYERYKHDFTNTTAIICSGMNPGVVQWMAIDLMKKFPDEKPKACYIVEEDTSFYEDESLADKDTIYTTWSTICFLDEAIYSYPAFMKQQMCLFLYKAVYDLEFKVTLGEKEFSGCLMPHEEVLTLAALYNMEMGFIYKVNDHTTNLIKENINNLDSLWDSPMKVLDPAEASLKGRDLVGILLVYEDKERYMYNALSNKEIFSKYGTNATYFQVACGIYGALATVLLDYIPQGIYYVDELLLKTSSNYGKYLSYYMKEFVVGENDKSEGSLMDRMNQ